MTARGFSVQTNFSAGMLDPHLAARVDVSAYAQGGADLTNVLGLPHGGVALRGGLARFAEVTEGGAAARLAKFEFSTEQVYLMVVRPLAIDVYLPDGTLCATVATAYAEAEIAALAWVQSLDTLILVHPEHAPAKLMREGSHTSWALSDIALANIPQHDFGSGDEDVWSAARGWPRSVFLHQGRLYFGGSKSRPQTVWGSTANSFFDFATSDDALDDEAVELTFDNDRVCAVQQLYALNDFFAFTSGGLFARTEGDVITPQSFFMRRSSEVPASAVRPAELDGSVMFVKNPESGHSSVYEIVFDYESQSYRAEDVALLSGHLMRGPLDMAARLGNESDSANHLYVVNGGDGTVAVLNSRKTQKMTGWTLLVTAGAVLRVAVAGGVPYFLVRREVAGAERYFIEALEASRRLDCSVLLTAEEPTESWGGLSALEGATVDLIGDGAPLGSAAVQGGAVAAPYPVSALEAGFAFDWAVETMPVTTGEAAGGGRHRITQAAIRLYRSAGLTVNGRRLSDRRIGETLLDAALAPVSGVRIVRLLGWRGGRTGSGGATVRITGTSRLPAAVLSVCSEVAQ
ncbi:hypothetical protein [Oleispirillum naphthae]|uniref:hypothetical protein n=1 Tax=Oleispirillum naphthae TaxID=2838853 RepID=UPI0030822BDE